MAYRQFDSQMSSIRKQFKPILTIPKDLIYVKLPYLGTISYNFEIKLSSLIKAH